MTEEKKKILLVDDEDDMRNLVTIRLENSGYKVLSAHGGIDALTILKDEIPDVVLLDILMPDMDGIEVCRQIKKMKYMATVPIIILSAKDTIEDKIKGLNEGVHDYITKPFDARELLARIDSVIKVADRNKKILLKDELTGLYNYNFFKEGFSHYFNIAKRYGRTFSLLMSDIDNFKQINDRHGHLCGNAVLEAVAAKLKGMFRSADVVTRYGGDEFAVILPETDSSKINMVMDRLRGAFKNLEVDCDKRKIAVNISVGVSTYNPAIKSPEELFDIADKNMYADKKSSHA